MNESDLVVCALALSSVVSGLVFFGFATVIALLFDIRGALVPAAPKQEAAAPRGKTGGRPGLQT